MDNRRLFFALCPDDDLRAELAVLSQHPVQQQNIRRVVPDNLHLTLLFLGQVKDRVCSDLLQDMKMIDTSPFELQIDRVEVWNGPKIRCLMPAVIPPAMLELVNSLKSMAMAQGLSCEDRPYRPHITIARKVTDVSPQQQIPTLVWQARSFSLMESVSGDEGVSYRALQTQKLSSNLG